MKTVSLGRLLSTCIDASLQGCDIIRRYQQEGPVEGTLKEGDNVKSVVTRADIDAQARIIGGLRHTWGNDLLIIGEEDEEDALPRYDGDGLRKDILDSLSRFDENDNDDDEIALDEIAIFVDPLDGTREFVEGRLQNVACLIGIAHNNRPVAGVIGVPFPDGTVESNVEVHYSLSDRSDLAGVWPPQVEEMSKARHTRTGGVTILTGDSTNPVLVNATNYAKEIAESPQHLIIGGTAAKLRLVASGIPDAVAILHFKTELWDTCAAEALLLSKGGKVTDLFGSPLVHSPTRPFGNIFGVVASSGGSESAAKVHDELCRRMRADPESVHKIFGKWIGDKVPSTPQAIDIARDLDGLPLDREYIKTLLRGENPNNLSLQSYSVPEKDACRGMMSSGVRISLDWDNPGILEALPPSDIFYKRVVMADLAHARNKLKSAPHKLVRDVKSYQVETAFLTSKACQYLIREAGINVSKVLGSDLRPMAAHLGPKYQLQSRFSVFLECFKESDGWHHQWLLDEEATKRALEALAKIHAYFWQRSQFWEKEDGRVGKDFESIVWSNGGYMQPNLQGKEQLQKVHSGWEARFPSFRADLERLPELKDADLASLGRRLEDIASFVGRQAHPFFDGIERNPELDRFRTFIHGDPKQANFFFRRNNVNGQLDVGIVDFQWSGFGLAATDVAHHIASAVMPDCLSLDGEKEGKLLDHYHSCLAKHLVEFGVANNEMDVELSVFPRTVLQSQYEVALLDICRIVFAYAWRRWKPESEPKLESLNRNAYNKSLPNVLWLVTRCHTLLNKVKQPLFKYPFWSPSVSKRTLFPFLSIDRNSFLFCLFGFLSASTKPVVAFTTALPGALVETICQDDALIEERAIPGAYNSVCMGLPERRVPLPKLQKRLGISNGEDGVLILQQKTGGSGQTGMTVWNSGLLLARLLDELVENLAARPGFEDFWSRQSVLELGCGTAVGSIAAHKLGAGSVVATDGNENVLELAQANIDRNRMKNVNTVSEIKTELLRWGLLNALDFSETASLVIGADLTYNAGTWKLLADTMETVLSADGSGRIIYLSLGHEGFNVHAEIDGFLSVAKEVGLVATPGLEGIDLSQLLNNALSISERSMLQQNGGSRVVVLKRKKIVGKG